MKSCIVLCLLFILFVLSESVVRKVGKAKTRDGERQLDSKASNRGHSNKYDIEKTDFYNNNNGGDEETFDDNVSSKNKRHMKQNGNEVGDLLHQTGKKSREKMDKNLKLASTQDDESESVKSTSWNQMNARKNDNGRDLALAKRLIGDDDQVGVQFYAQEENEGQIFNNDSGRFKNAKQNQIAQKRRGSKSNQFLNQNKKQHQSDVIDDLLVDGSLGVDRNDNKYANRKENGNRTRKSNSNVSNGKSKSRAKGKDVFNKSKKAKNTKSKKKSQGKKMASFFQ